MMRQIQTEKLIASERFYSFLFRIESDRFIELWRMKRSMLGAIEGWLKFVCPDVRLSAGTVAGCACELIENCIKYSIPGTMARFEIRVRGGALRIMTENSTTQEHIDDVARFIDRLSHPGTRPDEYYLERVRCAVETGCSRIGLAKILLESEASFSFVTEKGNRLRLQADIGEFSNSRRGNG